MTRPTVLVTGATGHTGSAVVRQLREHGWPVRALVRQFDARSRRLVALGAEAVCVDMFDAEQLSEAMRGVSRAYFLPVFHPHMLQSATAYALAAREARLESIVQMSQWLSSAQHPSLTTRQLWLVDRLFADLPGIAHTIVNPGMFADNFLRVIDMAALLGVFPVLTGDSRSAPVSSNDIARVVVAALAEPHRFAGAQLRPTGPALLSGREMAAILSTVLARRVRPVEIPLWLFLKVARQQGVDPFQLSGYRHYLQDHRRGAFEFGGGTTDTVRAMTGAEPESFEQIARRYASLPFAQRTLRNRVRALGNFLMAPFGPGYDLDRFDREERHPKPTTPTLSIENERWRLDHDDAHRARATRTLALQPSSTTANAFATSRPAP